MGTVTEIHDYLRLLFSRIGTPTCYKCGRVISRQTVQEIADKVMALPTGTKFQVLSPAITARKGEYKELFLNLRKDGFVRVRVDGSIYTLDEDIELDKNKKHSVEVVIDRLIAGSAIRPRLTESLETALKHSVNGTVLIDCTGGEMLVFWSASPARSAVSAMMKLSPRMFSI